MDRSREPEFKEAVSVSLMLVKNMIPTAGGATLRSFENITED